MTKEMQKLVQESVKMNLKGKTENIFKLDEAYFTEGKRPM